MFLSGKTINNKLVYGGVYGFYETYGLPLADIITGIHLYNGEIDWINLLKDLVIAGRSVERSIETVKAAIKDSGIQNKETYLRIIDSPEMRKYLQ